MYQYHRNLLSIRANNSGFVQENEGQCINNLMESVDNTENEGSTSRPVPSATEIGAQFILKIRDGRGLTQVATDGIIADTKLIVQSSIQAVEKKLLDKIDSLGLILTDSQLD